MRRILQSVWLAVFGLAVATAGVLFAQFPAASGSSLPREIVVNAATEAYDLNDPAKVIGMFQSNSRLKITEHSEANQAYRVEFTDPSSGNIIQAWCKAGVIAPYLKEDVAKNTGGGTCATESQPPADQASKPEEKPGGPKKGHEVTLKGNTAVKILNKTAYLTLSLLGPNNENFIREAQKNNRKLPANPPKFQIVDEGNKVLGKGKFEYGWGGTCRYSWRVPSSLKGKFKVVLDEDWGQYGIENQEAWFTPE